MTFWLVIWTSCSLPIARTRSSSRLESMPRWQRMYMDSYRNKLIFQNGVHRSEGRHAGNEAEWRKLQRHGSDDPGRKRELRHRRFRHERGPQFRRRLHVASSLHQVRKSINRLTFACECSTGKIQTFIWFG